MSLEPVVETRIETIHYGDHLAVRDVALPFPRNTITALIGPSGCGKSTVLRCLNRMNDLIEGFSMAGQVFFRGQDIYAPEVDPVEVRRYIGMVFQQPNPFAMSIEKNVGFGLRLNKVPRREIKDRIEQALSKAALWDEVKDKLRSNGLALSGGQQQRLCIARAIATEPEVLLMDEPCSALDPIATGKIEDLMHELKTTYTIVIVTHNMQQAQRVSDRTAFLDIERKDGGSPIGHLVELGATEALFSQPEKRQTAHYLEGQFG